VDELTVLTWNLQGVPPRRVGLPAVLDRYRPDVVFLQEVDFRTLEADAGIAGWTEFAYADAAAGTRPGMAILSRAPLLRASTLSLSPGTWDKARVLVADVRVADIELVAVCVHAKAPLPLPFMHAGPRDRQIADLGAWLAERSAERPVIAAGDFNAVTVSLRGMVDVGSLAAEPQPTWRPIGLQRLPGLLRLDRVFVSPFLRPAGLIVDCHASRSDHCPVVATFNMPA
jgi:endonuclease/exonuclease/phosphatase family metal-dependent hydrolase